MGTLAIKQLFENSELKGVELGLETATLEDQVINNMQSNSQKLSHTCKFFLQLRFFLTPWRR